MTHNRNATPALNRSSPMLTDASNDVFTHAMSNSGVLNTNSIMERTTKTCKFAHTLFKETFNFRRVQKELLQAVVDGNADKIHSVLCTHPQIIPDLLLLDPQSSFTVESKLTWQTFYAENPLTMAAKRKQINIIECLLAYYRQLAQTKVVDDARTESLSAWKCYEMQKDGNGNDTDQIIIPQEYIAYFESLVTIISAETFPYGTLSRTNNKLSEQTEFALTALLNILIPKKAMKLDDCLDMELFLLAALQVYRDENILQGSRQYDVFCIRVIGLILSVLPPETAEIWCESLNTVVNAIKANKEIKISEAAHKHKLKDGSSFYRSSRDSRVGQGFDFVTSTDSCAAAGPLRRRMWMRDCSSSWKNYVEQKQQIFGELQRAHSQHDQHQLREALEQSSGMSL